MKLFAHKATICASERLDRQKIGQEVFSKKLLQKKRDPASAISLECAVTFREWRLNGRVFACGVP
ncbi:hypothetical protein [Paraburkholderia guartelaensis]|uniref:hypothetical protein n=1 Tax=Paraburkholderia guartelaensis TaxID=2546446 RepID=UPI002AB69A22|nr:hypothetical protein [Paraburkholderia guartelaensis]